MYEVALTHDGLKAFRKIRGITQAELDLRVRLQRAQWDSKWQAQLL
jgi:hypothetical protein